MAVLVNVSRAYPEWKVGVVILACVIVATVVAQLVAP